VVYCFRGDSGLLCPRFVWTAVLAVQTIIPGDESLTVPVAKIISVALFTADDRDWRETDLGVDDSYVLSSHRRGTASKVPLGHLYLLPCVPFAQDDCAQLLLMTTAALVMAIPDSSSISDSYESAAISSGDSAQFSQFVEDIADVSLVHESLDVIQSRSVNLVPQPILDKHALSLPSC